MSRAGARSHQLLQGYQPLYCITCTHNFQQDQLLHHPWGQVGDGFCDSSIVILLGYVQALFPQVIDFSVSHFRYISRTSGSDGFSLQEVREDISSGCCISFIFSHGWWLFSWNSTQHACMIPALGELWPDAWCSGDPFCGPV